MRPASLASVVIAALLGTLHAQPERPQPSFARAEAAILAEMRKAGIPGAAVAVVVGDRVVWTAGLGVANAETQAPVTADTLFQIGSVTKSFTAAALLTAVVKSAFHASAGEGFDPRKVADRLAESIGPFGDDRFITAFIGRLDVGAGVLEYVGAGHPPALLWGAQEPARPIESADPILPSAFPRGSWAVHRTTLPRGFRLLVYTDGLPEAVGERQGDSLRLSKQVYLF